MLKVLLLVLLLLVTVLAFASVHGAGRWRALTAERLDRLESYRVDPEPAVVDFGSLEALPAPVQRYFRTVLEDGQPMIAGVRVDHAGTFNMKVPEEQWVSFTSRQRVVTRRPGFLWNARISMVPGLTVNVHDAYIGGRGILQAKLMGLLPVMELPDSPDLAKGEALRFFAEAAWYPTALLPGQGVTWEAVDDTSARATLVDGDVVTTMTFHFGEDGLITSARAEDRGYAGPDGIVPMPWEGRWTNYQRRDGMLVPIDGEVVWIIDGQPRPYWRGTITDLSYEFAGQGQSNPE